MNEAEALRIGREAVQAVRERVGDNRAALERELDLIAKRDPRVFEAFRIAGHMLVERDQEQNH